METVWTLRQTLPRGNVASLFAVVAAHIAEVLEDSEVARGDNASASGDISEGVVSIGRLTTQEQALLPLWQLRRNFIETPRAFLCQPLLDGFHLRAGHAPPISTITMPWETLS